jgi:RNA polymerase sigma factor (sigma-70 family)
MKKTKKKEASLTDADILKYYPLVKNIASYFYKLNSGVELEDLIQEGWIGLLLGLKKYDKDRNISLGAYCNKYIFGRIYRSQLGTRNLQHNKKMILMELSDKVIDTRGDPFEEINFYDFIENTYPPLVSDVLKMLYQNHKKSEIMKKHGLGLDEYNKIIEDFSSNFE